MLAIAAVLEQGQHQLSGEMPSPKRRRDLQISEILDPVLGRGEASTSKSAKISSSMIVISDSSANLSKR